MTINKTLISVAAATLLAAGFAGCGSSSSDTPLTPPPATSAIQSAVQAVDGYIYNATVTAFYVKDDNTTMGSVALTSTPTTKNTSTGVVTLGSSTYSLPDANASIKERIKFFKIATTTSVDDGNVTFTPAAYIEADGRDGYDVNDTLVGTTVIYAPATSKIASPLTSLAYQAAKTVLGSETAGVGTIGTAKADINTSMVAAIEANATKIATNLGLSGVDLLTADPIALASSNPTFKLVTGLLKGANATDAATILAATAPTTLSGILTTIATCTSGSGLGATFAGTLKTLVDNGAFTTADIATLNIEKSVTSGTYTTVTTPTLSGKFPISAVTVGASDYSVLATAGGKYAITTDNLAINMSLAKTDANVSNTTFNLLVAFKTDKARVNDDSNISSSFVAKIPFDLNITDGVVATAGIGANTIIPIQLKNADGSATATKSDINATSLFGTASLTTLVKVQSTATGTTTAAAGSNFVQFDLNNIVAKLVAADGNVTGSTETPVGTISDVQVMLQDSTGAIVGATNATTLLPLPKATFSDIGTGSITGTEVIKLINLSTLDMRSGVTTRANADGNASVTLGTPVGGTFTGSGLAYDTNSTDTNVTLTFADNSADSAIESNATVTGITVSNGYITLGKTALTDLNSTANGTNELNITTVPATINAAATGSHPFTVLKYTAKDEFAKAGSEQNVTFTFNRAPSVTTAGATAFSFSGIGALTLGVDKNNSVASAVTDKDGDTGLSLKIIAAAAAASNITEGNVSVVAPSGTTNTVSLAIDANATGTGASAVKGVLTGTVGTDNNITWNFLRGDNNGTMSHSSSAVEVQFRVLDANGSKQTTDTNITITFTKA
jgi:hypothetical protein